MRLGFVSAILPEQSLESVLGIAQQNGYQCVELMCWPEGPAERRYAGVTHLDVDGFDSAKASAVHELCERHGVGASGLGYYPNPLAPDPNEANAAVEHLRKVIDAAGVLGVGIVNTFIGRDWTKSIDDNWPRVIETWQPLIDHAESRGVRIAIENCPMLFTDDEWPGGKNLAISPVVWRRLFEEFPGDTLGLNYDPSHLCWQQMDPIAPVREFASRLRHIHAKDVRIDRAALAECGVLSVPLDYHEPKLPGLGEIDWRAFFAALCDAGYRGDVCVEVEDRYFEETLDSRIDALRLSHHYLSNFLPASAPA